MAKNANELGKSPLIP